MREHKVANALDREAQSGMEKSGIADLTACHLNPSLRRRAFVFLAIGSLLVTTSDTFFASRLSSRTTEALFLALELRVLTDVRHSGIDAIASALTRHVDQLQPSSWWYKFQEMSHSIRFGPQAAIAQAEVVIESSASLDRTEARLESAVEFLSRGTSNGWRVTRTVSLPIKAIGARESHEKLLRKLDRMEGLLHDSSAHLDHEYSEAETYAGASEVVLLGIKAIPSIPDYNQRLQLARRIISSLTSREKISNSKDFRSTLLWVPALARWEALLSEALNANPDTIAKQMSHYLAEPDQLTHRLPKLP